MTARALLHAWAGPLALASALALAACGRPGASGAQTAQASAGADAGYDAPPELDVVSASADGDVSVGGKARPSSQVRLEPPAGLPIETTADGSGAWSAPLGPVSEPTIYRLSEGVGGRRVEAEGLIAVLPGPTVAVLRSGAGAEVQGRARDALKILAVDYDSGGGTVVSGRAPAGSALRVAVDDQPAIEGMAEADGRFSLTLPKPLAPGLHRLQVVTPSGAAVEAAVPFTPPPAAKDAPFDASSQPFGWRIDWMTAGGGSQTTLLLAG